MLKRMFYKVFFDVELPTKEDKIKQQKLTAEQEQKQLEEQLISSKEKEAKQRLSRLNDSSKIIQKFYDLSHTYDNVELNQTYISLKYIHDAFVENLEYDITQLFKIHQFYTNSAIELLEKNYLNIDKKIALLQRQQKEFNEKISMFQSKLNKLDNSVLIVNKQNLNVSYTESIKRFFRVLVNSKDKMDYRLGVEFVYKSFRSLTKILTYHIDSSNSVLYNKLLDTMSAYRVLKTIGDYKICQDTLDSVFHSNYNITYICTFLINKKEIEIIKSENGLYLFCDVQQNTFYTVKDFTYLNDIVNEQNTESYNLKKEIEILTSKNARTEIELLDRNILSDQIVDVFVKFNEKLQDVDFLNNTENIDLEVNTLNALLNFDTK